MLKSTMLQPTALALAVAHSGSAIPAAAEEGSAAAVLDRHVQTFAAGDVETMLADYAEDAVFLNLNIRTLRDSDEVAGSYTWNREVSGPSLAPIHVVL